MRPDLKCGCSAHAAMRPVALAEALLSDGWLDTQSHRDELLALLRAD